MPYKLDEKDKRIDDVATVHTWFDIPVESPDIPNAHESYLIQPRVADYIVMLETLIGEPIKLKKP